MNTEKMRSIEFTYDCIPCAIGSVITLFKKGIVPKDKQDYTFRTLLKYFSELDYAQSPPEIARDMHRTIRRILKNSDPYRDLKRHYNQIILDKYDEFMQLVKAATDPFTYALRLSIAGNIIDFGPNGKFDVDGTIEKAQSVVLAFDDSTDLKREIEAADTVLFLGDNAGEIVLDRIFIETIKHSNLYFAVRGAPVINDVTMEDAKMVGIDKLATVITNGDDAPGSIIKDTSAEFQEIFNKADLIISKGQGNLESLIQSDKNIYFILMAKCDHVAKHLGCKKGDFLVMKNKNHRLS